MLKLLENTEDFVTRLLTEKLDKGHVYHNLRHTQQVVESTKVLIEGNTLSLSNSHCLLLAAWMHDIGYTVTHQGHESESCRLAKEFLLNNQCDAQLTEKVCGLIMATVSDYIPQNLNEEIIRDADSAHMSLENFPEVSECLREELAKLNVAHHSVKDWREINIRMLQNEHQYYTNYAKTLWQPGKELNLKNLREEKEKEGKVENKLAKKERIKSRFKNENPERGIQTMYRVTLRNHLTLSDIADTKANILLSVNAIILSLVMTNLIPKLDNPSNGYLLLPTAIFCTFSIASMILSVLATRPKISEEKFTSDDVKSKKVNLLFFGNFHKMKLEEYQLAIRELIRDQQQVYDILAMDLYYLGCVLSRKYKILRLTYTIFITGMIFSVISFFMALNWYGTDRIFAF